MNVLLVTDAYPPMRTSAANQIYDLAQAFAAAGHEVSIIIPDSEQAHPVHIAHEDGVQLIRVKAWQTKDVNYLRRTFAEWMNPFVMWHRLRANPIFSLQQYQGIVWYSPSIFWAPLIARLKAHFKSPSYLILRDIFPDWALDLGLIKPGLAYRFFKRVEQDQYGQADVIGVQSPNNLTYFKKHHPHINAKLEVLWNWVGNTVETPCSIDLSKTPLAGRKIVVYAGNMGVAQGMATLMDLIKATKDDRGLGFVFVGRGSEVALLKKQVLSEKLDNTLFFDEIDPTQIAGLYRQCAFGLIALDRRHSTHNIPGKFISYVQAGLPVIAFVNSGNDLVKLIAQHQLGQVFVDEDIASLSGQIRMLCEQYQADAGLADRARALAADYFAAASACKTITRSLQSLSL